MKINFCDKVNNTIEKFNLTNKSERLLAGLSGGADSVALLLCLYRLGYSVEAVHVNHQLRGEESLRDENFCVELCKKMNIPLTIKRIDVKSYCQVNNLSTEEGARILRYKAFEEINADKICTAHNLNDCLETTLFNLARGSGLKGIASIPPKRSNIIRPLIECTRCEIEEFLGENNQTFVTDSTNLKADYSRNKIRLKIIPQFTEINGSLLKTYGSTLNNLRSDSEYLEELGREAFESSKTENGFKRDNLLDLPEPIRRRAIICMLKYYGTEISNDKIKDVEKLIMDRGKLNIRANLFALCKNNLIWFEKETDREISKLDPIILDLGSFYWKKRKITVKKQEINSYDENVHKMFANRCLDYDKIKGVLVLRQRAAGDKIQLVNRDFTSDVRKLVNKAFTADKREDVILIADDEGVIFLEKYGAAQRVKISENTKNIIYFEYD